MRSDPGQIRHRDDWVRSGSERAEGAPAAEQEMKQPGFPEGWDERRGSLRVTARRPAWYASAAARRAPRPLRRDSLRVACQP